MKRKVFSIYDKKAELYQQPFMDVSIGTAERNFRMLVNDGKSVPSLYPEDYDLYLIAEYDEATGSYECEKEKVRVCGALDLKEKPQDDKVCNAV